MVKRHIGVGSDEKLLSSPGLKDAPVLDLMCSHFVLALAAKQGAKFNVRRDLNSLLALAGRHVVWPVHVLEKVRDDYTGRLRTVLQAFTAHTPSLESALAEYQARDAQLSS